MDSNRRLKKLFRSSKAGGIEPLLPPDPSTTPTALSSTPTSTTPTAASIHNGAYNSSQTALATTNSSFGPTSTAPIHDMHKRRHQPTAAVTPFPMDVGRTDPTASAVAAAAAASRRPMETREPNWEVRNVTLAEMAQMAQMEEEAAAAPYRRDGGQFPPGPRSRTGTGASIPPVENAWSQHGGSAPSPVSQPAFYLPPGAGPPSPQMRPSTPPNRMMQPGINNVPALPPPQASFVEGESFPNARARGYSNASQGTRLSDQEAHVAAAPVPKLAKPPGPSGTTRSPLASSYSEPPAPQQHPQPTGQYASWQSTPMGSDRSTPRDDSERVEKVNTAPPAADKTEKKRFWNWGQPKQKDKDKASARETPREREQREQRERGSQAQAQREREAQQLREREQHIAAATASQQLLPLPSTPLAAQMARVSIDDSRASHDERPEIEPSQPSHNGHAPSSIGHGTEEARNRPRLDTTSHAEGNDVGSAIHRLASSRETTHGAVLDVCERVNASKSGEAVGREAARTIRKILKSGTDPERRMALRIWWITMRNINVRGFRHYATNRKFMASVEPIITQQLKPPPSTSTLKTCRDILSDLTFCHYKERGCEGLYELWKRVKGPNDPEFGRQLPDDYLKHGSSGGPPVGPTPVATPGATPVPSPPIPAVAQRATDTIGSRLATTAPITHRAGSPGSGGFGGPPYASLPDHHEDMRRLIEECTAAKESARVLAEAIVYTRPEELGEKGVIKEFYTKCVLAHESLTNQMEWASSEAAKSRRVVDSLQQVGDGPVTTVEESALALVFEAHGMLSDSLKQYDDLEKMAMDEREMRAVQERSKKDTRMDRRQQMDMLMAGDSGAQASSSRSPSPALRTIGLPDEQRSDSRAAFGGSSAASNADAVRNDSYVNNHLGNVADDRGLSRTPSPDNIRRSMQSQTAQAQGLPQPPKKMASPTRTDSPLGRTRVPGPRPLPNPFRSVNSSQNLLSDPTPALSRGGNGGAPDSSVDGEGEEEMRPSRKALGKRRADPDNEFDPDDMFKTDKADAASDHSITADDIYLSKPIVYAYDAWAESEHARKEKGLSAQAVKADDGAEKKGVATNPTNMLAKDAAPTVPPKSVSRNGPTPADGRNLDTVAAR